LRGFIAGGPILPAPRTGEVLVRVAAGRGPPSLIVRGVLAPELEGEIVGLVMGVLAVTVLRSAAPIAPREARRSPF